jgi:hypothetical protein
VLLVAAACRGDDAARKAAPAASAVPEPPRVQSGDPQCPRDGRWKPCDLLDRLVRAGVAPKALDDTMRVPYLPPPGVRYQIGRSALLVAFYFADSVAVARALGALDTVHLTTRGDTIGGWPSTPNVIRSANLVAALFSVNSLQIERVRLAITAGPPQPAGAPAK